MKLSTVFQTLINRSRNFITLQVRTAGVSVRVKYY
jgi:hypothetical protein